MNHRMNVRNFLVGLNDEEIRLELEVSELQGWNERAKWIREYLEESYSMKGKCCT